MRTLSRSFHIKRPSNCILRANDELVDRRLITEYFILKNERFQEKPSTAPVEYQIAILS